MTFPRINVRNNPGNHERWGKLVKTWSTGKNYVDHLITDAAPFPTTVETEPKFPKPGTFPEFVAQAQAAGVELFFDEGLNGVTGPDVTGGEAIGFKIVEVSSDTHCVKLPPEDKIVASEAQLMTQGFSYNLPGFYERIHGTLPLPGQTSTRSQKAALHAERVGEYTINTCG
jgi:hypothetical protein